MNSKQFHVVAIETKPRKKKERKDVPFERDEEKWRGIWHSKEDRWGLLHGVQARLQNHRLSRRRHRTCSENLSFLTPSRDTFHLSDKLVCLAECLLLCYIVLSCCINNLFIALILCRGYGILWTYHFDPTMLQFDFLSFIRTGFVDLIFIQIPARFIFVFVFILKEVKKVNI